MSVVVDTLFDAPFTFELTEDDTIKSLSELRLQYPDIPESILLCEHKRLHYKYSSPLDTEVRHAQNTDGWMNQRSFYLTSSSIGSQNVFLLYM